ncbi:Gag-Pol polyprotein [Gossypium australe]|uniref:Gag-Pol polyprotein n=1 Tax=Gossypium australe TaxID=47621 RepID=A0A5B6WFT4_9ROSI|nr:Gag-Pol polyprotein [Gossypium australe]
MDPERAVVDDVESNTPASTEGTMPNENEGRPMTVSQRGGEEAREAFLHMMNTWNTEFVRTNPNAQPPPPPLIPQSTPVAPQVVEVLRREKPSKRKEFLELKQGKIPVTEYEREFVRLSKYARECVSTEAIKCKRFEDELNEDIKLFVAVLELKEFVVLVDWACKTEELVKEKRQVEMESCDSRKRQWNKSFQSMSKKSRDFSTRSATSVGFSSRSKGKQYSGNKALTTSVASVGNIRSNRPECPQCSRRHLGECRAHENACFKCGS